MGYNGINVWVIFGFLATNKLRLNMVNHVKPLRRGSEKRPGISRKPADRRAAVIFGVGGAEDARRLG